MKKLLAMALALLMVAVLLPVTAMAEGTQLGPDENGVIKLTNNVNLAAMAVVGEVDSNLTLDLNGCTITGSGTVLDVYGTLKIIDSSSAKTGKVVSTDKNAMWINDNTKVTMEAGTFEGNAYGIVVAGKNAEFTMNGGAATGKVGSGISGNGNETNGTPDFAPTTITINGGEITGKDAGIYHPQIGKLNINGGSISGGSGIEMRAGTLNVTGGTITATATASPVVVTPNGGGPTTVGAAIAVSQHTTKHEITVNVNGGELTGAAAIYESNPQNNDATDTDKISINVSGGSLTGKINKGSTATVTISGGTFSDEDGVKPYLADGKVIRNGRVENETIVIITPVSSPVFLSGANQTVAPGSAATFRIDKEFSELQSVAVDGVTLDKSNYKAWSGSTYVELLSSYMKTLSEGTHTLSAYFNGATATTAFTISKTVPAQQNPATGANDFVGAAAALAVVSLLGIAAVTRKK